MKKLVSAFLVGVFAVSSTAIPASAGPAMPTIWSASRGDAVKLEDVRHRHGYHGHHGGYYGHRHGGAGAAAAAGIIGLGIGAAIAAGAAEQQYRDDRVYAADREWDEYCFSKYQSYDPRTGTYLGYDGYRHPCQ